MLSTIAHDRIGNNAHNEARDIELFISSLLLVFLFFSLFFFLAVRSELSSISLFDCSFLPRAFLLPPLLSRPIARPRNSRDRWSGNRSFSSKILLSHLSIIVSHCVHAITIKYIFLLFSIYSSISNPRSETIYCHLIGKIRSFKETIGSSRIYIYISDEKSEKRRSEQAFQFSKIERQWTSTVPIFYRSQRFKLYTYVYIYISSDLSRFLYFFFTFIANDEERKWRFVTFGLEQWEILKKQKQKREETRGTYDR